MHRDQALVWPAVRPDGCGTRHRCHGPNVTFSRSETVAGFNQNACGLGASSRRYGSFVARTAHWHGGCERVQNREAHHRAAGSVAGAVGRDEKHRQDGWPGSAVPPAVARPLLDHGVAGAEHLLGTVVKLEDYLAREDYFKIDRVGGVHLRV